MKVIGVIPARYDSKRFPGKALAILRGKPMIQHVYESAKKCTVLERLIIATDDKRISEVAVGFGADVVSTPGEYQSGTDRVAYAIRGINCEIVVNIQGDQPFLASKIIEDVVRGGSAKPDIVMCTPIYPLTNPNDIKNPNIVKVVTDKNGFALYFSRSAVPYIRDEKGEHPLFKHIGVYAYRKEFLEKYAKMPQGRLEICEGLEQLRVLENGYRIMTVEAGCDSHSVDTTLDLELLEKIKKNFHHKDTKARK